MSRTTRALQMAAELSARCDRQAQRIRELTEAVVATDAQLRTAEADIRDRDENDRQEAADAKEDAAAFAAVEKARDAAIQRAEAAEKAAYDYAGKLGETEADREMLKAHGDEMRARFIVALEFIERVASLGLLGAHRAEAEAIIDGQPAPKNGPD